MKKKWTTTKLENLFSFVIGGDWGKDLNETDPDYIEVLCIRGSEFRDWDRAKGKSAVLRKVAKTSVAKRKLQLGDILVEISGGGPDQPVGRTVFIDEDVLEFEPQTPKVCTNFLRLVRLTDAIEKKYISYFLTHFYKSGEIVKYQGGSNNLRNLRFSEFSQIEVPLAPLPEQRRIVAKLDKLFAHHDQLKTRLDQVPVLLKQFRQAVLTQAVTGKLTEEWRLKNPNSINSENELMKLGIEWLKESLEIPPQWRLVEFGNYVENLDGPRVPISSKEREKRRGDFPYYGATGIIDTIDDFTHDGENLLIGEDGANLLSKVKPLAFITQGKIWVNNHAHVVKCKGAFLNSYLGYYINSIDLSPFVTGSAQPKLTQSNMNSIRVPVPSSFEQKEIVRRVELLFAQADKIEVSHNKLKEKIDNLPQAILAKAFQGELAEQDPSDGSAEELLKATKQVHEDSNDKPHKKPHKTKRETTYKTQTGGANIAAPVNKRLHVKDVPLTSILQELFDSKLFEKDDLRAIRMDYSSIKNQLFEILDLSGKSKNGLRLVMTYGKDGIRFKLFEK